MAERPDNRDGLVTGRVPNAELLKALPSAAIEPAVILEALRQGRSQSPNRDRLDVYPGLGHGIHHQALSQQSQSGRAHPG